MFKGTPSSYVLILPVGGRYLLIFLFLVPPMLAVAGGDPLTPSEGKIPGISPPRGGLPSVYSYLSNF